MLKEDGIERRVGELKFLKGEGGMLGKWLGTLKKRVAVTPLQTMSSYS